MHSPKDRRSTCQECEKTFSATTTSAFYCLRKETDLATLVVKLLSCGCPAQAIVFALDDQTVKNWFEKSVVYSRQVHEHLVEQPHQVLADELQFTVQSAVLRMAMAIQVSTRLWSGGEVSASRDSGLIENLIGRIQRCASAQGGPLLFSISIAW